VRCLPGFCRASAGLLPLADAYFLDSVEDAGPGTFLREVFNVGDIADDR
jgi:hypothetical protein